MSNFTKEDVQYFADFARLALTEEEKVAYAEQLQQMVELTAKLKDVNTEGVAPMTHPLHRVNVLREDKPADLLDREEMLKNVPEHEDGMIQVPNTF